MYIVKLCELDFNSKRITGREKLAKCGKAILDKQKWRMNYPKEKHPSIETETQNIHRPN